jgi:Leucine-rich repeat (LRR) protein
MISSFSKELCYLKTLQDLNFGYNKLVNIPLEISNLIHLRILMLNNNLLEIIPDEILKLTFLTRLSLYKNKLTNFPNLLNFLNYLEIDDTSYKINNITFDTEILIFSRLFEDTQYTQSTPYEISNLPLTLKYLYLKKKYKEHNNLSKIRLPYGCQIIFY